MTYPRHSTRETHRSSHLSSPASHVPMPYATAGVPASTAVAKPITSNPARRVPQHIRHTKPSHAHSQRRWACLPAVAAANALLHYEGLRAPPPTQHSPARPRQPRLSQQRPNQAGSTTTTTMATTTTTAASTTTATMATTTTTVATTNSNNGRHGHGRSTQEHNGDQQWPGQTVQQRRLQAFSAASQPPSTALTVHIYTLAAASNMRTGLNHI